MNKYENLIIKIRDIVENGRCHPSEDVTLDIIDEIKTTLNDKKFNKNLEQARPVLTLEPIFLLYHFYNKKKLPEHLHNAMISHGIKNPDDDCVKRYLDISI